MTLPYLGRLLCLALGAFFLTHAAVSAGVWLLAKRAVRSSVSFDPKIAARLLFWLRLLPAAVSALLIGALFAPSYLLFEPRAATEKIGALCLVSALLGIAVLSSGVLRAGKAIFRSAKYLRTYEESDAPVILVAGLFRPRLVVSESIRNVLTAEELASALRHEEAHGRARDNLKRLLILLSPNVFPFYRGLRALDAGWQRMAEWAADDSAAGSSRSALALASALIRVGRLNSGAPAIPLGTSLLADTGDLRTRVERLIGDRPSYPQIPQKFVFGVFAITLVLLIVLSPALLPASHELLEALAH